MGTSLDQLAARCGLLRRYIDWRGHHREAPDDAVRAILASLDVPIEDGEDAAARALDERARDQLIEPCMAVWGDEAAAVTVNAQADGTAYRAELALESGQTTVIEGRLDAPAISLPAGLAHGYHRLTVELGDRRAECAVIAAPVLAFGEPGSSPKRWGVFAPTYALQRADGCGAGDLGDLVDLAERVADLGGDVVGTLPLLAAFLGDPEEVSPYSPVSRQFWNELYLDLSVVEGAARPEAWDAEAAALRDRPLVDYSGVMALKRRALEPAVQVAWSGNRGALEQHLRQRPQLDDYARFRATVERHHSFWQKWPQRQRAGELREGDYDEAAYRYHVFVQYEMDRQLERLGEATGLYLDLPVGVNLHSFDVWRSRESFAVDASVGAPPDALFSDGQNWRLPPPHPERIRERGYRYFADCLRHHMRYASTLRIDHVMGLHRLFWIPENAGPTEGIYVHYRADEMYAVLSLESHRHRCGLVGEDLGTVPDQVRPAMERHGAHRLYVTQFGLPDHHGGSIAPVPADAVASLNTHDTPTFASFWHGTDIDLRADIGVLDEAGVAAEWERRRALRRATAELLGLDGSEDIADAVMRRCTELMAESDARLVLVTLEDLWLELSPQNVPGTGWERPNWRRKMGRELDALFSDPDVIRILRRVNALRRA